MSSVRDSLVTPYIAVIGRYIVPQHVVLAVVVGSGFVQLVSATEKLM